MFHALDEKHIASIARIQLQGLEKRLAQMEMKLEISDAALDEIAKAGFDPLYGARPLKRACAPPRMGRRLVSAWIVLPVFIFKTLLFLAALCSGWAHALTVVVAETPSS